MYLLTNPISFESFVLMKMYFTEYKKKFILKGTQLGLANILTAIILCNHCFSLSLTKQSTHHVCT